jgi:DNA-binding FadR family transcriptional regulator
MSIIPTSSPDRRGAAFLARPGGRGLLHFVVDELGARILDGTYEVGQTIPIETALMAELSVSRTVLREALKILSAKGLVESRPKTGTRVRPRRDWNLLDPTLLRLHCQFTDYSDFALHFQQLRGIIEPEAAALAAINCEAAQLEGIVAAYEAMARARSVPEWTQADLSFHRAILEATGNPFVMPLGSLIHAALETLLYHSASDSADPFASLQEHLRVLDAIRSGDADGARAAMKGLLRHTNLAVSQTIDDAHQSVDRFGTAREH